MPLNAQGQPAPRRFDGPALIPLAHHAGKPAIPLHRPVTVVGSRSTARIHLMSSSVSKAHALLVHSNGRTYVRDLASRTHVYVNGQQIREAELSDGDMIKIGSFTFKFSQGSRRPGSPPKTVPPAELDVTGGEFPIPVDQRVILIGRRSIVDIPLLEESASTAHAVIFEMDGDRYVRDLGSRTGTFVNGVNTHQHKLSPGDVVRIGETDIRYKVADEAPQIDIPGAGESAAAYALEAPTEEFAPEPQISAEVEHDTMGGLDLLGEVVKHETAAYTQPPKSPAIAKAPDTEIPVPLELAEPAPAPPAEPVAEPVAETVEPTAPAATEPLPSTSAEIEDIADELLAEEPVQEEKLSEPAPPAETTATPAEDLQDELHPRRGWRTTISADEPELDAPPQPSSQESASEPEPAGATETEPQAVDDQVLRFDDQREDTEFGDAGTAVLDQEALAGDTDQAREPIAPLSFELELPASDSPGDSVPVPFDLALEPDADTTTPAIEPAEAKIDFGGGAAPAIEEIAASALDGGAESEASAAPIPEAPIPDLQPAEPPPPVEASPAVQEAVTKPSKRVRKPRTRKPRVGEQVAPVEVALPVEAPVAAERDDGIEVVDQTDPSPESALDLDDATKDVTLDESAIADVLAAGNVPQADELTDSTFTRAVEDLTSATPTGELIEEFAPALEAPVAPVAAEPQVAQELEAVEPAREAPASAQPTADAEAERFESLIDLELPAVDEAQSILPEKPQAVPPLQLEPAAEAPSLDLPGAAQTSSGKMPTFEIGANQENFLGGIPLPRPKLPPRRPAGSRDPVDDLIAEIDTAAAAAERAGTPGDPNSPWAADVPPALPRFRRPRAPRKPATDAPEPGRSIDESIPPYRGEEPGTAGHVTLGFDGLAMPPVRQMDVFAQMSPPPAPAEAQGGEAPSSPSPAPPRKRARQPMPMPGSDPMFGSSPAEREEPPDEAASPELEAGTARPRVLPEIPGAFAAPGGRQPPVTYAAEESEVTAAELRRKRLRRVPVLFGTMIALILGSIAGIYWLIPVKSSLEANLIFRNLESRSKRDREQFHEQQRKLLSADTTRRDARARLSRINSEISPGFLDDQLEFLKVVDRAGWPETRKNVLAIPMQGTEADVTRLQALILTLFDANKRYLDESDRSRHALRTLQDDIARNERRLGELKSEKESLRVKAEQTPTAQQIKGLDSDVSRLLEEWNRAIAAVKNAEADLARLKVSGGDAVAGANAPANPAAASDEEIQKMQRELDGLQARADEQREQNASRAEAARKALDEAMTSFQTEIAAASQLNQGNPELAAYVASAQRLQETTKNLIDDLTQRQERQFSQLMELKERLNDKLEARRNDMWMADKELQQLTERLAILTRQYNAAVGGGLQKEADDLRAEIDLAKSLIKARQDLIPGDAFYADAVQQLEAIVENTKKGIEEDRVKTDQLLEQLQKSFVSSPPASDKLPAEQRDLAQQLERKLANINEARRQYNAAIDVGAADVDATLKQQIATLTAGIEARRQQLADASSKQALGQVEQDRAAAITAKEAELDALRQTEQIAEKSYLARNKDLRDKQLAVADGKNVAERLDEVINQQGIVEVQLRTLNNQLEAKQKEAATAIEPVRPGENDVLRREGIDRRPIYAGASGLGILILFSGLILWTWQAAAREAPFVALAASDLKPESADETDEEPSPAATNGDGQHADATTSEDPEKPRRQTRTAATFL